MGGQPGKPSPPGNPPERPDPELPPPVEEPPRPVPPPPVEPPPAPMQARRGYARLSAIADQFAAPNSLIGSGLR
jgi:hypothetical protein